MVLSPEGEPAMRRRDIAYRELLVLRWTANRCSLQPRSLLIAQHGKKYPLGLKIILPIQNACFLEQPFNRT